MIGGEKMDISTALRDLADRVDAGDEATTLVCVIASPERTKIYTRSTDLRTLLTQTAELLTKTATDNHLKRAH